MMTAKVYFYKDVEEVSCNEGCSGSLSSIVNEIIYFDFEDTEDLCEQMANWTAKRFDVNKNNFLEYVNNEIENNRFDYSQNEDGDGNYTRLTENNPDGFHAMYCFLVDEVYKKIEYKF